MPRTSLVEYLSESSRWGDDVAVVWRSGYRTERWTYAGLLRTAHHYAAALAAHGVQPGDRVFLWSQNSGEWIAAFWAVLLRGAVVVPMDAEATPDFARNVARQVQARLLIVEPSLQRIFEGTEFAGRLFDFAQLAGSGGEIPKVSFPNRSRRDIAEIIFTSGSTAEPKGVVLTHGNLLANIEPLERELAKYRKYERWVHPLRFLEVLPLSHVFGQFMGLFVPPLLGAAVVFADTLNPSGLVRTTRREKVNVLVAVPRVLESLRRKIGQQEGEAGREERLRRNLAAAANERFWKRWWRFRRLHGQLGWRFWAVISGGAALSHETEEFWRRLGLAVIQGYGLTETASLISLRNPFSGGDGSIGRSLPGREMKLDENGEILVRGENVAAGYWSKDRLQPVAESEGWFRTGDLGEMDRQGNLYFKGRKKNVLVTAAGMNVYPEDIEAALRAQPGVRDCAVVLIPVDGREVLAAALVLRATDAAPAEVVRNANRQLAEYQHLHYWLVWPHGDLPRTSTGKPRLGEISATLQNHFGGAQEQASSEPAGAVPAGPLRDILRRMNRAGATTAKVTAASSLESDLMLSSIDRVELLSEIEDRFQMDVDEAAFANTRSVGDLENLLQGPTQKASPYPYVRWPRRPFIAALREVGWWTLVLPAMLLLGYPRAKGREHLRGLKAPFLLISNHQSEIDAAFLLAALPNRLRRRMAIAMGGERLRDMRRPPAGTSFFKRLYDPIGYALLAALFHVFPLPKQSGVRGSFEFIGELVDQGWSVMIFPEGQLTKDGAVGPFRSGIGVLANSLNTPIVPAKVSGLFELRRAGRKRARRGEIRVSFSEPERMERASAPEAITARLRQIIVEMP